jgi:hypothetical protein
VDPTNSWLATVDDVVFGVSRGSLPDKISSGGIRKLRKSLAGPAVLARSK